MALQTIPGVGLVIPEPPRMAGNLAYSTTAMRIDATGEKAAMCGRVWNKDHAQKTINKVQFRFGAVTKAGGSALIASLQDVSLTAGAPMQPDETQDQYRAIANGDANFASNAWYTTGLITSDGTDTGTKRVVNPGDLLAFVVEFDGAGRLGADTVDIACLNDLSGGELLQSACVAKIGAGPTWTLASSYVNVILEFSDGTFGTLEGAWPCSAIGTKSYKQDTGTADEWALTLTFPCPVKVDGAWVMMSVVAATSDFSIVLYNGTTAMTGGTVAVDANAVGVNNANRLIFVPFSQEISLNANTTYRLSVQPTQTTSNVTLQYFSVDANGHFQAHGGGVGWNMDSRLDTGAWIGAVTTDRPFMGVRVSSIDDGAGASGGGALVAGGLVTGV